MTTNTSDLTDQPRPGFSSTLAVFRTRTFLYLWCGALISNIGNWMENAGQNWAVVSGVKDNPRLAALLTEVLNFADFAPVLLLALAAGVISDRVDRRKWLLILQSLACLLGAGLAVVGYMGLASPGVVIGFTAAEGVVWAFTGPTWLALVPAVAPREYLPRAVALNSVQFNLARLIGPVLAGLIILRWSVNLAFAINAATFVFVIAALFKIPPQPPRADRVRRHPVHDLKEGLRFVTTHRGIRQLAIMAIIFMFLAAPVQGLLAVYAHQVLHGQSDLYGWMLGSIGLGSVLGALFLGRIPSYYPRHHLIPLAMTLFTIMALAYSFSTIPLLSLPLLLMCGFFWLMALNSSNTANQLLASDEMRGRVMSVMFLCIQGSLPLGHLAAAGLTTLMPATWVLRGMLCVLFICTLVFLIRREPAIDNLTRRQGIRRESFGETIWEAITADSHRPARASDSGEGPAEQA
ncbi:MAG TPA: MFS transporter [Phycisphaerae bacterium]|nr:MFS transporter [Phycisphaerae bacterium]